MNTRKCKFCGNDLDGYRSRRYHPECYKKHKRILTNIYVQGKQGDFDAEYARLKAGKTCACCGAEIEISRTYCDDCKSVQRKVYHRVHWETYKIKIKSGAEVYNRKSVDGEILVSDATFETDLCDMDCARCKYADCILPEDCSE